MKKNQKKKMMTAMKKFDFVTFLNNILIKASWITINQLFMHSSPKTVLSRFFACVVYEPVVVGFVHLKE